MDKGHGRIETREIWTSTELNDYVSFPYVRQVLCVKRTTTDLDGNLLPGRKTTEQVSFGVTSLSEEKASPEDVLSFNRGHWSIENKIHYVRDRTFDEDRSQVRKNSAPQVMATLRNIVMGLLRLANVENIAAALRYCNRKVRQTLRMIGLN